MAAIPSQVDTGEWLEKAEGIIAFLRDNNLVAAIDHEVWLMKGNAVGQLSAYLQHTEARKKQEPISPS